MLEDLVIYLDKVREKEAAITLLEALQKHSVTFEQYDDLGKCFFKIKEYKRSIKCTEHALSIAGSQEKLIVTRQNLINVYNHANLPELAMRYIKQQEIIGANNVDNKLEKAFSHFLLNEKDKAEQILHEVLNGDDPLTEEYETKIKFNLGTYYLYKDQFQLGMRLFLLEGRKLDYWQHSKLPFKFWEGEEAKGKDILLFAEAGIGDEIINVRFMQHLKDKGMNPIWLTDRKDLAKIFNRSGFKTITSKKDIPVSEDLLWTYPMCLPVYLNLEYEDLWKGSYLDSDKEYDDKYDWMNKSNKLKIGVRWQGNPEYDHDLHRSVPLKEMYESLKDVDAEFYSLQRDVGLEEIGDFPEIIPMHDHMKSFDDTLSIIKNLDIVITTCTSIAHASAAMGKTTYIMIPISAYYTWSHSGKQSPWYGDNVTLFRQQKSRSWKEPLKELKNNLSGK